ncbi:DUF885 domain-containing protein [Kordiimonas lacus]|uniref:Uncharacterized conserved protein, DUF885 familyt n=1 Tax=Kordiimonas lacus TaxID=637679 RepID=A0A1G7CIN6_9PROT|nr:DUF885 domain-containing protein [Kordiimonas lacus]SDE39113.1 Uncharacterized conserved protein, DUF885 familyt [Kordiimonas lacus]
MGVWFKTGVLASAIMLTSVTASGMERRESAEEKFQLLMQDERAFYYQENPGTGPRGKPRPVADRFRSLALEDQMRRAEKNREFLARLDDIKRKRLDEEGQLNYDMFRYMIDSRLLNSKHRTWRQPLFSDSGFHTYPTRAWQSINFRTVADYQAYIRWMRDLPRYLAENTAHMRTGLQEGFTMPKVVLKGLMPSFDVLAKGAPEDSSFYGAFVNMAASLTDEQKEALRAEARAVIKDDVLPAYATLASFMHDVYYPAARESLGISEVPGGAAYYEDMVRYYTTIDISPDEVHQIGLSEVARIRAAMEAIIEEVGFEGSFAEFLTFLRTDPQFYAKTEKELLMVASYLAKKADGKLPALFGKLPRQPYGVEPVPAVLAPNYTTGRYSGAPLDAPRGGEYWVNTYALDKRPLYTLPALTLHEAVPGHHLQIALSQELENVPEFRLGQYPHAFGEGWGLYSERLGEEMGLYETPYERFGRLTYEMWRACRLVIDTGIHSKGWTREAAIQLLTENSALSEHNIRTEVDRYIAWPGQALAYKMGELKIVELREKATKALGDKFDVRAFHDKVLSAGGIPLYILESRIDEWIEAQLNEEE